MQGRPGATASHSHGCPRVAPLGSPRGQLIVWVQTPTSVRAYYARAMETEMLLLYYATTGHLQHADRHSVVTNTTATTAVARPARPNKANGKVYSVFYITLWTENGSTRVTCIVAR